jgi:hypothetical protein
MFFVEELKWKMVQVGGTKGKGVTLLCKTSERPSLNETFRRVSWFERSVVYTAHKDAIFCSYTHVLRHFGIGSLCWNDGREFFLLTKMAPISLTPDVVIFAQGGTPLSTDTSRGVVTTEVQAGNDRIEKHLR